MDAPVAGSAIPERDLGPGGALPLVDLVERGEPVVLRGVARHWDLVQAGLRGPAEAMARLRAWDAGRPVQYSHGAPETAGRPFYTDDFTALNFDVRRGTLGELLDAIASHVDDARPPMFYLASLPVDVHLPGFREANDADVDPWRFTPQNPRIENSTVDKQRGCDRFGDAACLAQVDERTGVPALQKGQPRQQHADPQ